MTKDNSAVVGTFGAICLLGGIIWTIGLAVREQPPYLYIMLAGVLVIAGVLLIAVAMRDEKWTVT